MTCPNCGGGIGTFSCGSPEHKTYLSQPEPMPITNELTAIQTLVIQDMQERMEVGRERYGTYLQPNNGRKALIDWYQEILDAAQYCRQEIEERILFVTAIVEIFYEAGYGLPQTQYETLHQLKRDIKTRMDEVKGMKENFTSLRRERIGEVWFWSTGKIENGDNAKTITCPILIQPEDLNRIIAQRDTNSYLATEISNARDIASKGYVDMKSYASYLELLITSFINNNPTYNTLTGGKIRIKHDDFMRMKTVSDEVNKNTDDLHK